MLGSKWFTFTFYELFSVPTYIMYVKISTERICLSMGTLHYSWIWLNMKLLVLNYNWCSLTPISTSNLLYLVPKVLMNINLCIKRLNSSQFPWFGEATHTNTCLRGLKYKPNQVEGSSSWDRTEMTERETAALCHIPRTISWSQKKNM